MEHNPVPYKEILGPCPGVQTVSGPNIGNYKVG